MKKILPVLLTLILALTLCLSITVFAADSECTHTDGNDKFNNICDDCEAYIGDSEISFGENSVMMGVHNGTHELVKFVPQEDGCYEFYSTMSDNDPRGYLYDADLRQLAYDDDNGDGLNFLLAYNLVAGETYYFAPVTSRDVVECSFTIANHGAHVDEDSSYNICDTCNSYLLDYDAEVGTNTLELVSWYDVFIRFIPEESGVYKIHSTVNYKMDVNTEQFNFFSVGDYSEKELEFGFEYYVELTAGETYYISIYCEDSIYDGENTTCTFTIESHEHNYSVLTCLGMLCDCGFYDGGTPGSHRLDTTQTCVGYQCIDCTNFFGEGNDNHLDVSTRQTCKGYLCFDCYEYIGAKGEHNLGTTQYCAGYKCLECFKYFDEGTGLHEDGNDSNVNMCDICDFYLGTGEIAMGENTVSLTDGKYAYVKFVPSESTTYEITVISESNDIILCYDEDLRSVTRSYSDNTYYVILEANKTYYLAFSDASDNSTEMVVDVELHEHSGGTQYCLGYLCACGEYYGEKDLTNHSWNCGTCYRCDAVCEHTTEPIEQDCRGYLCECGVYYGEKNLIDHTWSHGICYRCDAVCEHTTEPIGQDCRGYICECGGSYGEKLDHTDGSDHKNNMCDNCSAYLGTVDAELGENWVDIEVNRYTYVKFIPEESGDYYIYSISNSDPEIVVLDSYLTNIGSADDQNGRNFKILIYLTAGETYYFGLYSFGATPGYNYVIEKHEHSYVLSCLGSLCVCGDNIGGLTGAHVPEGVATCIGTLCSICEEYYGDSDPNAHNWYNGTCADCYTYCNHETTPIKHICNGYLCECGVVYGEGGGDHYDNDDVYINLCDYCMNEYLGTVDVVLGGNTLSREELEYVYVRFIPSESGVYKFYSTGEDDPEITIYDENFDEIINADDTDDYNFEFYIKLTANETYYLSLYDHTDATEINFTIETHEHSGGEQYCKGYLCECGYFYGEKGDHVDRDSYMDNVCDICNEYTGDTDAVIGSNIVSYKNNHDVAIRFIPAESGFYKMYSIGDTDPVLGVYNTDLERFAYADDSNGYGFNYVLYVELVAGETYYLASFDYEICDESEIVIEKHEHSFDNQICVGGLCECGNLDTDVEANPDNHLWYKGECMYHPELSVPEGLVHDHVWVKGACCICEDVHKHQTESIDPDRRICSVCYASMTIKVEGENKLAYFSSIYEALDYVEDGDTVQMLSNIYLEESVTITKNITFDLNGCAVRNYSSYNIYANADVRFIDSSSEKNGWVDADLIINSSGTVVESGFYPYISYSVGDGKSIADILGSCVRVYDEATGEPLDLTNTDVLRGYVYFDYDHNEMEICTGTVCLDCGERTYGAGDPDGHNFDNYEIIENASCKSNAIEKATCTWCEEETDTREVENTKKPHRFIPVYGEGYKVCSCGERIESKIYSGDAARNVSAAVTRAVAKAAFEAVEEFVVVVVEECLEFIERIGFSKYFTE